MATFKFEGIDDLIAQYEKLGENSEKMISKAIYEGVGVVYRAIQTSLNNINTDNRYGTSDNPLQGPSSLQKAGLEKSLGIAPLRNDNGFVNRKIGFDGYNGVKTKTWPSGQPNVLIARSVESGTSWMTKQPFMRTAETASKSQCEKTMRETIDKELKAIIK